MSLSTLSKKQKSRFKKKKSTAKQSSASGKRKRGNTSRPDSSGGTSAGAGEATSRSAAPIDRKKPEDMTAGDIHEAIVEVDKQIEAGKALLPADASRLQRALYTLKMALLELGGVDPQLAVQDRENLEELIAAQTGDADPDPATQRKVTQAADEVKRAQSQAKTGSE